MIALTVSSSRLNARPKTSFPKSSSSEAMQAARPWMRAMPSPISTTVPTSADSAFPSKLLICALMMSVISEDVVATALSLLGRELDAQRLEARADRGVDEVIAHLDLRPADQRRIDHECGAQLLARGALQAIHQRL